MSLPRSRSSIDPILVLSLVASEAIYLLILRTDAINGAGPVLAFLALLAALFAIYAVIGWRVLRGRLSGSGNLAVALAAAVIFRVTLLPAGLPPADAWQEKAQAVKADLAGEAVTFERFLLYDHDIWRYLWDGRVAASGINPYVHAPESAALDSLEDGVWGEIRWNVNHPHLRTIYPPAAQGLFRVSHAIAPGSIIAMKGLLVLLDLAAIGFLILALRAMRKPLSLAILYALNPLVIKVFAGSGHVDALLVAALCATVWLFASKKHLPAMLTFAVAVLTKLSPLILLPFVLVRLPVRLRIALAVLLTVFLAPMFLAWSGEGSGLRTFAGGWEFNGGVYALLLGAMGGPGDPAELAARVICAGLLGLSLFGLMRRDDGSLESLAHCSMWAMGLLLLFSPAVFPWYVTWVLPFAVLCRSSAWLSFSALVWLSLFVMIDGRQHSLVLLVEYGLLLILLLLATRHGRHAFVRAFQQRPVPTLIEERL